MFSDGTKLFNMQKFLSFLLSLQNFRKKMQNILSAVLVFQEKKIILLYTFQTKLSFLFQDLKILRKKLVKFEENIKLIIKKGIPFTS